MFTFVLLEFPEFFTEPPAPPCPIAVALPPVAFELLFEFDFELLLDCDEEFALLFD